jgi:TonB family protein
VPESLYVGIYAVSDASPFWFDYVLDVRFGPKSTHVTLLRIAPLDEVCPTRITVKAKEATIPAKASRRLTGSLCSLSAEDVDHAIASSKPNSMSAIFESASYAIVKTCAGSEDVLRLPMPEEVDLRKMWRSYPNVERLWDLPDKLFQAAFRGNPLASNGVEKDVDSQRSAEPFVERLRAGAFDKAFPTGGLWASKPLSAILAGYHGIATSQPLSGEAQNRDVLGLDYYVPAVYPPLAKSARIEGGVEIAFRVNSETGTVEEASAVEGHPLLKQAALDAVRHWRFKVPFVSKAPTVTVIRFSLSCPTE